MEEEEEEKVSGNRVRQTDRQAVTARVKKTDQGCHLRMRERISHADVSSLNPKLNSKFPQINLAVDRRLNGFLGLSLNERTIVSLAILLDKTVSVR